MPLYRRSSTSLNGFSSFGSKGSVACSGQFVFSNSPQQTGANQFSYLICENNTQGFGFSGFNNPTGYLNINLDHSYLTQGWFIRNNIIAIGEYVDGSQSEYFNTELNSFVFSEANSPYNVVRTSYCVLATTRPEFNVQIFPTESGVKYQFEDSFATKMKWTSKIEIIQNVNKEKVEFSIQSVNASLESGIFPQNSLFNLDSDIFISIEGGIDGDLQNANNIEAGIE
jgi:hypothetical protein